MTGILVPREVDIFFAMLLPKDHMTRDRDHLDEQISQIVGDRAWHWDTIESADPLRTNPTQHVVIVENPWGDAIIYPGDYIVRGLSGNISTVSEFWMTQHGYRIVPIPGAS